MISVLYIEYVGSSPTGSSSPAQFNGRMLVSKTKGECSSRSVGANLFIMDKKVAKAGAFPHSRALVNFINKEGIQREDIVKIIYEREQMILIYYGYEKN